MVSLSLDIQWLSDSPLQEISWWRASGTKSPGEIPSVFHPAWCWTPGVSLRDLATSIILSFHSKSWPEMMISCQADSLKTPDCYCFHPSWWLLLICLHICCIHQPISLVGALGPDPVPTHPTHRLMISSCFDHQHPKNISWIWLVIPYIYIHNRSTIIKLVIKHKSHNSYVKTTKNISKRNSTPEGTCFFFSAAFAHMFSQ